MAIPEDNEITPTEPLRWRVYYGDGGTFSNLDGAPEDAPALNVQAIVEYDPSVGRSISMRRDFYIRVNDAWMGVDWFGLLDQLMAQGIIKAGRSLPTEQYEAIYQRAASDPGLPRKSALHWLEQRPPGEVGEHSTYE